MRHWFQRVSYKTEDLMMRTLIPVLVLMALVTGCKEGETAALKSEPAVVCPSCRSGDESNTDDVTKTRDLVFGKAPGISGLLSDRMALALALVSFVHHNTPMVSDRAAIDTVSAYENLHLILTDPTYGHLAGGLAVTTADVLTAFGYTVRTIQLFSSGGVAHVGVEFYQNGVWVAVDPTFNLVFSANGSPIDYKAIFALWRNAGQLPTAQVIDTAERTVSGSYSTVLDHGRSLPTQMRTLPGFQTPVPGQEIF